VTEHVRYEAKIHKISDDGRQVSIDVGSSCIFYLPVDAVDARGLRVGDPVSLRIEIPSTVGLRVTVGRE
jgi:hypothetical protein